MFSLWEYCTYMRMMLPRIKRSSPTRCLASTAGGFAIIVVLYFFLIFDLTGNISRTESKVCDTFAAEEFPTKRSPTNQLIFEKVRAYMNPLKALIDQSVHWHGEFRQEIDYLKRRDDISDPVRFLLKYNTNDSISGGKYLPSPEDRTRVVNCAKLFESDPEEMIKAEIMQERKNLVKELVPSEFAVYNRTRHCNKYIKEMGYIVHSITQEEEEFPIAYSIIMYEKVGQVERLLRAIYRPQNYYCIHVDIKSSNLILYAMRAIASCFENVFIASQLLSVRWGHLSVLQAELICMNDLWEKSKDKPRKWKYFINLTGQEFPLKTNWELVQILKSYKGSIDVGHSVSRNWKFRTSCSYNSSYERQEKNHCIRKKNPPPHNLTTGKGPVHVALTRQFVDFALHDRTALDLLSWLNNTIIPDETFFQTLFLSHHKGVPGAYTGKRNSNVRNIHPLVRFKKWEWWRPCRGNTSTRHICLMTIWDLPELAKRPEMFVNKFKESYHPLAYSCLEELIRNRTREDILTAQFGYFISGVKGRELPYSGLPWVRNHI